MNWKKKVTLFSFGGVGNKSGYGKEIKNLLLYARYFAVFTCEIK